MENKWTRLKQDLLNKLHQKEKQLFTTPEEGLVQSMSYPPVKLGKITLSTVSNWIDTSDVVTEIPYSLSDTPIFQDSSREDYIYYGSIPNMNWRYI